ncbi:hypothetical protein HDU96_007830 [Phlyctochytrium bullatum]|nr:hypothetical protein HDU96_007830 [Phlyctochytrium bullatum]
MLIPIRFKVGGLTDFKYPKRSFGYGLPFRRWSVPDEFVEWLRATITKALELDVIAKVFDVEYGVYFLAIWLGSVNFLQFAIARLLFGLDPGNARTAMVTT